MELKVDYDDPEDNFSLISKRLELYSNCRVKFTLDNLLRVAPDIHTALLKAVKIWKRNLDKFWLTKQTF